MQMVIVIVIVIVLAIYPQIRPEQFVPDPLCVCVCVCVSAPRLLSWVALLGCYPG